jgi:hypothetical protein
VKTLSLFFAPLLDAIAHGEPFDLEEPGPDEELAFGAIGACSG